MDGPKCDVATKLKAPKDEKKLQKTVEFGLISFNQGNFEKLKSIDSSMRSKPTSTEIP